MADLFIVDDDKILLFALKQWFSKKGYIVTTFTNSAELLNGLRTHKPDFILLDVYLTGEHGGDLCRYLKQEQRLDCVIYLFSAGVLTYKQFDQSCADGFVLKRKGLDYLTKLIDSYIPAVSGYEEPKNTVCK